MKQCNECHIQIDSPVTRCPLCYAFLITKDEVAESIVYPNLHIKAEAYNMVLRILLFLSLTIVSVSITINWLTFKKYYWSLVVVAAIAYAWIAIGTALRHQDRLGYTVMVQAISLSALIILLSLIFDFMQPVFNYVLPALFVVATLSISIIVIAKRMDVQAFILYFILTALLGFIPIILLAFNLVTVSWPAIASALYSGLSLISLFIFADSDTKKELKKRFKI